VCSNLRREGEGSRLTQTTERGGIGEHKLLFVAHLLLGGAECSGPIETVYFAHVNSGSQHFFNEVCYSSTFAGVRPGKRYVNSICKICPWEEVHIGTWYGNPVGSFLLVSFPLASLLPGFQTACARTAAACADDAAVFSILDTIVRSPLLVTECHCVPSMSSLNTVPGRACTD